MVRKLHHNDLARSRSREMRTKEIIQVPIDMKNEPDNSRFKHGVLELNME